MVLALKNYFLNIKNAFVSIFEGLAVTLSYLARKPITIQYPDRIPKPVQEMLPTIYRGVLEVDIKICTGCLACMKRCPIDIIKIETYRDVESKNNYMTRFDIDIAKCMFCGLCTEVCPTGSIRHSTEFEASSANVINMVMQYIRYGDKVPVYKPVKDQEPESIPQNEAFRQAHKVWDATPPLPPDMVRGTVRWKSDKPAEEKS